MLGAKKAKQKTVAEKVNALISHPNDSESSEESADEAPRTVDFDDEYDLPDARTTEFRKRNVKLLSEQSVRYKGKIASRNDGESDRESDRESDASDEAEYEQSDSDEDNAALEAFNSKLKEAEIKDENYKTRENHVQNGTDEDSELSSADAFDGNEDDVGDNRSAEDEFDDDYSSGEDSGVDETSDIENAQNSKTETIVQDSNNEAEVRKGQCVQNQLHIWERLLELRINTQKVLNKANQLPGPEILRTQATENEELENAASQTKQSVTTLLQKLLELQHSLTGQFSEVKIALKDKLKRSAPFNEEEPEPKRFAEYMFENFQAFQSYRNDALLKWDDRTKLLTPGAGNKKKSLQEDYDIIKKLEAALANRSTLIERSQVLKNINVPAPRRQVNAASESRNVNIYDDSDFYHQQLRELIEYKANTTASMSEITKQFVELQKLRQKMKKKVDTRASKGRKLRYVVHKKLVNFMAPNEHCDWTDHSKNELFKSLFV